MLEVKERKSQIRCSGYGLFSDVLSVSLLFVIVFFGACSTPKNGDISPLRKEIEYSVNQMLDSTDFKRNEGFIVVNILDYEVDQFSFAISYLYNISAVVDDHIALYFKHRGQKILIKFGKSIEKREKKIIRRELGSVLKFNNRVKVDINHVLRTTETGMFTYSAPNFFVKVRDGERDCTITYGGAPPGTSIRD